MTCPTASKELSKVQANGMSTDRPRVVSTHVLASEHRAHPSWLRVLSTAHATGIKACTKGSRARTAGVRPLTLSAGLHTGRDAGFDPSPVQAQMEL